MRQKVIKGFRIVAKKSDQEYHMNRIRMQIIKILSYVTKNVVDEVKRRRINRHLIEVLNELDTNGNNKEGDCDKTES